MNRFQLQGLLDVGIPPSDPKSNWYENAPDSVEYLFQNLSSDQIILYANFGQAYIFSVLALRSKVSPPNGPDLKDACISADSHWTLQHVMGGGQPDRMYLEDPLECTGCSALVGGAAISFSKTIYWS